MKLLYTGSLFAFMILAPASALAQGGDAHGSHDRGSHQAEETAAPVNAICPVGKEAIDLSVGTVEYNGHEVGVCCAKCGEKFLKWDDARKDKFIAVAMAAEPGEHANMGADMGAHADASKAWTEPYPLGTCPVSGQPLGSMGDPVVKMYDGREVRFCCGGCIEKFESDRAGYWKKIDQQIIASQLPYYPTQTCVVSDEPLTEDGEDIAINMVYGNRLIRLCCKMCRSEFKDDPAKFIAMLDKATADAQRADYPLDTCIVRGGALGSMGEPSEMVMAGRLFRFCCPMCEPKVRANPSKYITMIDEAWQAKGMFAADADAAHEGHKADESGEHGGHGDHDHGG